MSLFFLNLIQIRLLPVSLPLPPWYFRCPLVAFSSHFLSRSCSPSGLELVQTEELDTELLGWSIWKSLQQLVFLLSLKVGIDRQGAVGKEQHVA